MLLTRITLLAVVASGFSSCAYQEVMDQRNQEGRQLERDLDYEIQRGRSLQGR